MCVPCVFRVCSGSSRCLFTDQAPWHRLQLPVRPVPFLDLILVPMHAKISTYNKPAGDHTSHRKKLEAKAARPARASRVQRLQHVCRMHQVRPTAQVGLPAHVLIFALRAAHMLKPNRPRHVRRIALTHSHRVLQPSTSSAA